MEITLKPDFCCGGGHCGPMPGYFYSCPYCGEETSCRTTYELEVGDELTCDVCKKAVKATEQYSQFRFEFELLEAQEQ